jgi:hypothetical protein
VQLSSLVADLNCLYYLSPSLRAVIKDWVNSDWCCLSCIGVALDPQPEMEEDEQN